MSGQPECAFLPECFVADGPDLCGVCEMGFAGCGFALGAGMEMAALEERYRRDTNRSVAETCMRIATESGHARGRGQGAAETEARYRAGIRAALRALHAVHANLPDGETLPRQSADALALAVEGALLAALGGEA